MSDFYSIGGIGLADDGTPVIQTGELALSWEDTEHTAREVSAELVTRAEKAVGRETRIYRLVDVGSFVDLVKSVHA